MQRKNALENRTRKCTLKSVPGKSKFNFNPARLVGDVTAGFPKIDVKVTRLGDLFERLCVT